MILKIQAMEKYQLPILYAGLNFLKIGHINIIYKCEMITLASFKNID